VEKSEKAIQYQLKEMLKREFRVVKSGLDPDDVLAYIETIAGSSEAALKRLEQFSSLQKLSLSMEAMVAEANQLAEHIRAQTRLEAEAEKHQIIEEAKHQAEEMLEQSRKMCLATSEGIKSALLEARTKAREIEDTGFQKAEEIAVMNMEAMQQEIRNIVEGRHDLNSEDMPVTNVEAMQQDIHNIVEAGCRRLNSVFEESTEESPTSPQIEAVDTSDEEVQETVPATGQVLDPAKLQESNTPHNILGIQLTEFEAEEEREPVGVQLQVAAPEKGDSHLYNGEATLVIPQGARQSWMRQLRQRLLSIPGLCINLEVGSDIRGTMMTLSLDEPVALTSLLLEMPNVKDVMESQSGHEALDGVVLRQRHRAPSNLKRPMLTLALEEDALENSLKSG